MPSAIAAPEANSNSSSPPSSSAATVANVSIVNDPKLNEHDVLELSKDVLAKLFPQIAQEDLVYPFHAPSDLFVLVKLLGAPDYFKKFVVIKVDRVVFKSDNSITLINNSNLAKFDNDSLTLNKAIVKSVDSKLIPPLTQVFVSVPNDIYHLLHDKSESSVKSLFETQFLAKNGNVVNEGDCIRLLNGQANLCEPVAQGRVDSKTNYVLINESDSPANQRSILNDDDDGDEQEVDADEIEDFDLSTYLSSSLTFDKRQSSGTTKCEFLVRPLPERINVEDIPLNWSQEDPELFVYVNNADLIKLGIPIFNGDLVKLKPSSSSSPSTLNAVIVRIFSFTEPQSSFETGFIYTSPILLLNLGLQQNTKVELEPVAQDSILDAIPVAESATISRVSSQITMDKTYQASFLSSLKSILSKQRKCVQEGDYFPVVIDTILAKTIFDSTAGDASNDTESNSNNHNNNESGADVIPIGNPDAVAWFKITEIKGSNESETKQYQIDPTKTMLVSSGVESTKLPTNKYHRWHQYLGLPPIFNYAESDDFRFAQEFTKILSTCILSKLNLKTSILLTSMSRGIGKTTLVRSTCLELGLNLIELDCFDFINPGQELKTIGHISGRIDNLISPSASAESSASAFHVIYLKHMENLCPKTDDNDQNASVFTSLTLKVVQMISDYLSKYRNLVVVMSCNDYDKLSDTVKALIKFTIEFTVPTENERLEIFRYLINNEKSRVPSNNNKPTSYPFVIRKDINYKTLALQSAGLTPRDLISIVKKSKKLAIKRLFKLARECNTSVEHLINIGNGGLMTWIPEDFEAAINEARSQFSDSIGAPRIPNVKWEDVGGLDLIKDEILDTIDMPLKHPELFNNGLKKRSGILFYGPPGTGKTLLAKAIATNFSLNFFSVKGPELLNMYIGESEANVRRVFQRARDAKPCVIFFDELDSVAPKRGNQGDSGGVMDRIVSQLLAELDGMSSEGGDGVFVVGATNRPDLLDEALLRPGRFDKMLYLGISDTDEKQTKIMEALTRKFQLDESVDLSRIAAKCSFTYTGADFYALCSDSMLNAMTRVANEVDEKIKLYNDAAVAGGKSEVSSRWWFDNVATKEDTTVAVKMEDFVKAQDDLVPSVSAEELQHYLRVRENFEGGKEKARQEQQQNHDHVADSHRSISVSNGATVVNEDEIPNGAVVIDEKDLIDNISNQNGHS
ncbi:uncharacterized protein LODBEIA_P03530 [Lodderomyces beijingensis]|uniref:Peroxisomal ATPase PEX6 n=1 Tax=Lodderomyces beijingensis TaxID=1775926 RepID=A0ABP0ZD69_9ASCO